MQSRTGPPSSLLRPGDNHDRRHTCQSPVDAERPRRSTTARQNLIGWLFVGPFGIVFLPMLILPLGYALYLSLFQKALIGGTSFVFFGNYVKAFNDPSFLDGVWFVIRFSLVLIPLPDGHLARHRAHPGHGDHPVRPLLAPHDLHAVRDPRPSSAH